MPLKEKFLVNIKQKAAPYGAANDQKRSPLGLQIFTHFIQTYVSGEM